MTYPHGGASSIWRDGDGAAHNPEKGHIRDWGGDVEKRIVAVEGQAFTADPVFADAAAGLAGTAEADQFKVENADADIAFDIYRHDAGPVATFIVSVPSQAALSAKSALLAYLTKPSGASALAHILAVEIFSTIDGVAVTLPSQMTVREIARDNLDRFRVRFASFDGASTYGEVLREDGNGTNASVSGETGLKWIDLYTTDASLGVASGTLAGRVLVDFRDGSTFGTYFSLKYDHVDGGVYPAMLQAGAVFDSDVDGRVLAFGKITRGSIAPFADDFMGAELLRRLVRNCHVYTRTDEPHALRFYFEDLGGGSFRIRGEVLIVSSGQVICSHTFGPGNAASMADFAAGQDTFRRFDDRFLAVSERTRLFVNFEFDWSVVADLTLTGGTTILGGVTVADGGLHESVVFGEERTERLRMNPPLYGRIIRVGTGGDFASLAAAIASLHARQGDLIINGRKVCDEAHPASPILIRMLDDADEEISGLYTLDDVHIEGRGIDRTRLISPIASTDPVTENHGTTRKRGGTEIQRNATDYVDHRDLVNNNIGQPGSDGITEHEPLAYVVEDWKYVMDNPTSNAVMFGSGLSAKDTIILRNVEFDNKNPNPLLNGVAQVPAGFVHNSGASGGNPSTMTSDRPGYLVLEDVRTNQPLGWELATIEAGSVSHCRITSSVLNLLKVSTSSGTEVLTDLARDRNQWVVSGLYEGAFLRFDPVGENVLKTTAGQEPSGDAAALIFGSVDELGRGEKWIGDGNDYDLGSRLGDCSTVNKTLTIGGQTHTFTANEAAKSNATLLGEINATITAHPLSIVDVQLEWVPDAAPKRRMNNDTGSTIPKGRFVKFTGAGTVALCGDDEAFDGWTHRDILDGDDGFIIRTKTIADAYIEGASSGNGEWGISAGGLINYAATNVLGRTAGGLVRAF